MIDPKYVLMTKLGGTSASTITSTATSDEVRDLFRQIGATARACHAITFEHFGYIGPEGLVDVHLSNHAYMSHQLERHLRTLRDQSGDPSLVALVERRVAGNEALFANCHQPVLCHDDLHEQNVLVERRYGRWVLTGLVDVENAVAADPLLDLAKADYYAREDPVRRSGLLEGYGALPHDGEARLDLYRLHHALALWSWFARIGRVDSLPGISDDIARLAVRPA